MRRLGDRFAPFAMKPVVDGARNPSNQPCGNHNFRQVRRTHTHPLQLPQWSHERIPNEPSIGGVWLNLSDSPFDQWTASKRIRKLLDSINNVQAYPIGKEILATSFGALWPKLEERINAIPPAGDGAFRLSATIHWRRHKSEIEIRASSCREAVPLPEENVRTNTSFLGLQRGRRSADPSGVRFATPL
jgi:hypothetical protein